MSDIVTQNTTLLSVREAAKLTRIGVNRLYRLIKERDDLPVVRLGRTIRIPSHRIQDLLDKLTQGGS